jgi:S1-C subfamily serine protease
MTQAPPLPAVDEPAGTAPDTRGRRLLALVLLVLLVLTAGIWRLADAGPASLTRADVDRQVAAGIARAQKEQAEAPPPGATAYRAIQPSMVTIRTSGERGSTLGAGVVISTDGTVLTALHVVSGGDDIQVTFSDGTRSAATVVKKQPAQDIAVLAARRLPSVVVPAVMGGSVRVGTEVYPVGHPLGLVGSLSAGVVSALDRSIRTREGTLKNLIQFDAAVNPGNSGGPLLDRDGHVVGIVTALANPADQPYFVGIGFAVPIATAGGAAGGPSK